MKPAILRSTGRKALPLLILVGVSACKSADTPTNIIFSCDDYTVYTDSVAEGMRTARAVSPFEIEITDHDSQSPATILKPESSGSKFPRFSSRSLLTDALQSGRILSVRRNRDRSRQHLRQDCSKRYCVCNSFITRVYRSGQSHRISAGHDRQRSYQARQFRYGMAYRCQPDNMDNSSLRDIQSDRRPPMARRNIPYGQKHTG